MFSRLFRREDASRAGEEGRLERSLEQTRRGMLDRLKGLFGPVDITDTTWEELEGRLIQADVGVATSTELVTALQARAREAGVRYADELPDLLAAEMERLLRQAMADAATEGPSPRPWVSLVVGVNGSGKTTSIAKLAHQHRSAGRKVVIVAADTFRAAAIEQLQRWGERVAVPVVAGQSGGEPAAVVFDALASTQGRQADVIIVDTAGRLHTQTNLMAELVKVRHVVARVVKGAPHETLLVLDATTGQNGLAQARAFTAAVQVTGILLAKLDSSARGGVALAVTRELGLPILYVGTGEGVEDLAPFDPTAYVAGLLGPPRTSTGGTALAGGAR